MTTMTQTVPASDQPGWFKRTEAWLDARGKGAWIAAMIVAFVLFWPIGLALLAYMIWSNRMFSKSCRTAMSTSCMRSPVVRSTGNSAFDAYKADTLKRLEEEQDRFEAFLERLREAKDKAEFDQFMDERVADAEEKRADA